MLDAETALGVEGQSRHADGNRNFLVARNGGRANDAKSMALSVNDGAAIVLKLRECQKNNPKVVSGTSYFLVTTTIQRVSTYAAAQATKRHQAWSTRLEAAFGVHAADSSLCI